MKPMHRRRLLIMRLLDAMRRPAGMALSATLRDSFNDSDGVNLSDHTPDQGPAGCDTWSCLSGEITIQSGQAVCVTSGIYTIPFSQSNFVLSGKVYVPASGSNFIVFRVQDASNLLYARFTKTDIYLYTRIAGANTGIATDAITPIAGGTPEDFSLTADGEDLSLILRDGYASASSAQFISETKVGLWPQASGQSFDDFQAAAP